MGPSTRLADGCVDLAGARRWLRGPGRLRSIAGHCRGSGIRGAIPADGHYPYAVGDGRRANRQRADAGCQLRRQCPHDWVRGSAAVGGYSRDSDLGLVLADHRSVGGIHRRSVRHHP